jgi:hypothetical protein
LSKYRFRLTAGWLSITALTITHAILLADMSWARAASDQPGAPAGSPCKNQWAACVGAADAQFTVQAKRPGRLSAPSVEPVLGDGRPADEPIIEETYTPTCFGNGPGRGDALCSQASQLCATPGQTAFWAFSRRKDVGSASFGAWGRILSPAFTCLAADDPVLNTRSAIPELVEAEFRKVVVRRGVTLVQPAGRTLVHVDTIMYTETDPIYEIPNVMILGTPVHITATARTYTWHFGDGQLQITQQPGRRGDKIVTHRYTKAASVAPYVEIEWSGTYRIGDDPQVLPVRGTARTQGVPTPLAVLGARTQLEAGVG